MAKKIARVLVDGVCQGIALKCDQLLEAEQSLVASLEKAGQVDSDKAAVAYARSINAAVVVIEGAPAAASPAPAPAPAPTAPPGGEQQ